MPVSKIDVPSLRSKPEQLSEVESKVVYTLPDMHGNAMYLLYMCGLLGIFEFNDDDWRLLWYLYDKSDWVLMDFQLFSNIVENGCSLLSTKLNCPSVRLIGDLLADRGKHDYLTLIVLEKLYDVLQSAHKKLTIIFSNHDHQFLRMYSSQFEKDIFTIDPNLEQYGRDRIEACYHSVFALKESIEGGVISYDDVKRIVDKVFLPNLQLLDYEAYDEQRIVFSHAPVCSSMIEGMLDVFCNEACASPFSLDMLGSYIEPLNTAFKTQVTHKDQIGSVLENSDVLNFIQSRGEGLKGESLADDVIYVHGHMADSDAVTAQHRPIDGLLGMPEFSDGLLKVFVSVNVECSSKLEGNTFSGSAEGQIRGAVGSKLPLWTRPPQSTKAADSSPDPSSGFPPSMSS